MAKKSFNIASTLKKNQESQLGEKIPLQKKQKDLEEVEKKVAIIHQEEQPKAKERTKEKASAKTVKTKVVSKKTEKLVRLTIDTPAAMHRKLKIRSIERGVSMRDYILELMHRELSE